MRKQYHLGFQGVNINYPHSTLCNQSKDSFISNKFSKSAFTDHYVSKTRDSYDLQQYYTVQKDGMILGLKTILHCL